MKNRNRGQIRIIEAFLAIFIIFTSFTLSSNLTVTRNQRTENDLASIGSQTLMALDSDGGLGKYFDEGNWTSLREALDIVLPIGVIFNMTIYNEQMQQVNTIPISNGELDSQQIAFTEYYCVSQNPIFHYYIVHLHLAVAT